MIGCLGSGREWDKSLSCGWRQHVEAKCKRRQKKSKKNHFRKELYY